MVMASSSSNRSGFTIRRLLFRHLSKDDDSPLIPAPPSAGPTGNRKKGFASALRGLGCSSAAAADASVPSELFAISAIRSSADWQGTKASKRKRRSSSSSSSSRSQYHEAPQAFADVSGIWCAPGVVFESNPPADGVVAHRQRDSRALCHRERTCNGGGGGGRRSREGSSNEMRLSALLETPSSPLFGFDDDALHSGQLQYFQEVVMMSQSTALGGMHQYDQYRDLRLDVDNMSYEELLELSEKIGHVSNGLREEEIFCNLRRMTHSLFIHSSFQKEAKCIICQEEYEGNDDMGRLECGHSYHSCCIKKWLLQKNACPVCKTAMAKS